jgi:hypothetical protein
VARLFTPNFYVRVKVCVNVMNFSKWKNDSISRDFRENYKLGEFRNFFTTVTHWQANFYSFFIVAKTRFFAKNLI